MANQKGKDAFEFVKTFLEKKPGTPYAEVAEAAKAKGHKIWPIVFGRAQLLLGQAKVRPATKKKAAAKKAAMAAGTTTDAAAPVRRGPGRPRKNPQAAAPAVLRGRGRPRKVPAAEAPVGLDNLVAHIRGIERERDQLRAMLEKLRALLAVD